MKKLVITDLHHFDETKLSDALNVVGGTSYAAGYQVSFSTDKSAGYVALYSVNPQTHSYSYVLGGQVSGVAAAGIASAISVGDAAISVYATTSVHAA